jgi:hypothetical protein
MRSLRSPLPTCSLRSAARAASTARFCASWMRDAQQGHGALLVLQLAALLLARDHGAGRHVRDAHGGFGLVDVLAAGTAAERNVSVLEVLLVDVHLDLLDLRQHRDGRRRRVHAPLGLGLGHPLHAVAAGLELHRVEDALAAQREDDLLEAALLGGRRVLIGSNVQPMRVA